MTQRRLIVSIQNKWLLFLFILQFPIKMRETLKRHDHHRTMIEEVLLQLYIERYLLRHGGTSGTLSFIAFHASNITLKFILIYTTERILPLFLFLWYINPDFLHNLQWSVFWTTPDPFEYFCTTNQFEAFFKLPTGSQSNLTAIQEAVCSLNFNLIQLELLQFYNVSQIQLEIDRIIRHDPSLEPFNWTVWIVNNMRWSDAVNRLVSMPTGFVVDTAWWNKTEVRVHDILMNWLEMQSMISTGNR